jgi:hypothetical protein
MIAVPLAPRREQLNDGVEQTMKRPLGMQNLKRRFSQRGDVVTESGVYPIAQSPPSLGEANGEVTLVVYGWQNVQPGTLSWVFPSFDAAMKAASALRNATQWAILGGSDASGTILAERSA